MMTFLNETIEIGKVIKGVYKFHEIQRIRKREKLTNRGDSSGGMKERSSINTRCQYLRKIIDKNEMRNNNSVEQCSRMSRG